MVSQQLVNILLVEDDSVDRMNVERAFKKNNVVNPLHFAQDGQEAFEMLKGINNMQKLNPMPKIMLLDINMPRMNGLELLKEIRNDDELRRISVFVLTTSNDDKDKLEAFNNNVAGYILKPLSFASFVSAVSVLNNYWQLCEMPE